MATKQRRVENARILWTAMTLALTLGSSRAALGQGAPPALDFYTIAPCRLYDSRDGDGPLVPGEQREIQVATVCEIPEDALAVAANVTAVEPTGTGSFSVFPDPLLPTGTNAVSYTAGTTRAASGVYSLSGDGLGTLSVLAALSAGQTDLTVDATGFFWDGSDLKSHTGALPVCKHGTSVQAVDCWEGGLLLTGGGTLKALNAYRLVKIRIDYRQNGTLRHSTYAYWDGGRAFTFRTSFPFQGTWTWTAVCETGCAGRSLSTASGTVSVTNRRTSPVMYSRGFLNVDPSGRFLRHQTGMKFFWLGDTAWAAPMRTKIVANSSPTWGTYLTNRTTLPTGVTPPPSVPTAGKFSVTQLSLAFHVGAGSYTACTTGTTCLPVAKRAAFTTPGALRRVPTSKSHWNPAYWQNLDRRVYEANEKGLVVALTGVMDPFGYAPDIADTEDLKIFARNLAARMAGFFVVYSVGWDNRAENATYSCGSDGNPNSVVNGFAADGALVTKMKTVGAELNTAAPSHLITTHLGGGTPFFGADTFFHDPGATGQNSPLASSYSYFHREPWLDFHLFQSSQCNLERASTFQHQGTGTPGGTCQSFVPESQLDCVMRRARTMPAKFLSLRADDTPLAGPPLVKPAANGEARYERTVLAGQPAEPDIPYQSRHAGHVTTLSGAFGFTGGVYNVGQWRWPADGMGITGPQAGKSPGQLKYLSVFQEGQVMEWERLRRKELMLRNAGTVEKERSVVAASESNQYIVGYLPERAVQAQRNLELAINQGVFVGFDSCRWSKTWWNPFNGQPLPVEAAAIVRLPRTCESGEPSPCFTFQFGAPACSGNQARPNDRCDWVLLLDDLLTCPSAISQTQIWSGQETDTGMWGVFAEQRTPEGVAVGGVVPVSDLSESVQATPKVANGVVQGALAVWVAEDSDGEGFGVVARKLDPFGLPAGVIVPVSDPAQGDQVSPSVAAVGATGYVVTWTSYSADGDQGEVYARYLDGNGNPLDSQFQVNVWSADGQGHSQVASDAVGNVLIAWESWGQDGDGNGVFARRYDPLRVGSDEF